MSNSKWKKHPEHEGFEEISLDKAPEELRQKFEEPTFLEEDGFLGRHEAMSAPIAWAVSYASAESGRILWEGAASETLLRDREDNDLIIIASEDEVFKEAYMRGLSCLLVRDKKGVPNSCIIGRNVVLVSEDKELETWSDDLYLSAGEDVEAIWTATSEALELLADGDTVDEACGLPEMKHVDQVASMPGMSTAFVEHEGALCRVVPTEDGEREFEPILNCVPRTVDLIEEEGRKSYLVRLDQGGTESEEFELTPEIANSGQDLVTALTSVGYDLPRLPDHIAGSQKLMLSAFRQWVHAQWPSGYPPATRVDHWGRVSLEDCDEDIWLFDDQVYIPGRGLLKVDDNTFCVGERRILMEPSIVEDGQDEEPPRLCKAEVEIQEVEDVVGRAHGEVTGILVGSFLAYCGSKILPSVYSADAHFLLFMVGVKGSGKSTALKLMLRCFGQPAELHAIHQGTAAGVLAVLGAYQDLPVGFDGYKNEGRGKTGKDAHLRQAYDKGSVPKGRPERYKTTDHKIRAIPMIDGEHVPDDDTGALLSRGLVIDFDREFEEDTADEMAELKERAPAVGLQLYNRFVEFGDAAFQELLNQKKERIGDNLEERGFRRYGRRVDLYAYLLASREVAFDDSEEVESVLIDHLVESLGRLEGLSLHNRFLEVLVTAASKKFNDFSDFARVYNGTELRLGATNAVGLFEEQAKKQGLKRVANQRDILGHLQNYSWFIKWNELTRHGPKLEDKLKSWCIDLSDSDVPEAALELAQIAKGELAEDLRKESSD